MSFRYGQFGEGFGRMSPAPEALRLAELCTRRGEEVTVVRLRRTGEGAYGEPVYSEDRHAVRAMVERGAGEETTMAGDVKTGRIRLYAFAVGLRSTASTSTRGSGTDGAYPGTTGRRILEAREVDL